MTTFVDDNVAFSVEAENENQIVAKFVSKSNQSTILLQTHNNPNKGTVINSFDREDGEVVTSIGSLDNLGNSKKYIQFEGDDIVIEKTIVPINENNHRNFK